MKVSTFSGKWIIKSCDSHGYITHIIYKKGNLYTPVYTPPNSAKDTCFWKISLDWLKLSTLSTRFSTWEALGGNSVHLCKKVNITIYDREMPFSHFLYVQHVDILPKNGAKIGSWQGFWWTKTEKCPQSKNRQKRHPSAKRKTYAKKLKKGIDFMESCRYNWYLREIVCEQEV